MSVWNSLRAGMAAARRRLAPRGTPEGAAVLAGLTATALFGDAVVTHATGFFLTLFMLS